MSDLGNLNSTLRLHCKECGWRPPEDTTMEAVQLHCQVRQAGGGNLMTRMPTFEEVRADFERGVRAAEQRIEHPPRHVRGKLVLGG